MTITGSEFGSATAVSFGSSPASSVTVESPTQIKALAPAGSETVDVTVTNAKGASAPHLSDQFTYAGLPTVTKVAGDFGRAGETIQISGTNLGNPTEVHFGAVAATSFRSLGSHAVAVVVPGGAEGVVDVTVTNPTGTSEANPADEFMYESSPNSAAASKRPVSSKAASATKAAASKANGRTPTNGTPPHSAATSWHTRARRSAPVR